MDTGRFSTVGFKKTDKLLNKLFEKFTVLNFLQYVNVKKTL